MAKGIETLAGPVSENDVIMRENEAPVGAAALMNKQVRKSVPGFYKLPSQEKETPGFMKVAKAGVEKEMAQGDTISNMAGTLMREGVDVQGMNQDQIIMLYEQMMGSTSDRDQFGVTDATKILNSIAPDGEKLAYINPDEAGILAMLGGSGDMTPQGIPSFRPPGYNPDKDNNPGFTGYNTSNDTSSNNNISQSMQEQYQTMGQSLADAGLTSAGDVVSSQGDQQQNIIDYYQEREGQGQSGMGSNLGQAFAQTVAAREGDVDFDTDTQTGQMLSNLSAQNFFKDVLKSNDPKQALLDSDRYKDIQSLMDDYTPLTGNIGLEDFNLLGAIKTLAKGGLGKKKKDRLTRKNKDGEDTDEMTQEGFMEKLGDIDGGRDTFFNLIKRLDPENFYKVTGMPQTSGGLEEMAGIDATKFGSRKLPDGSDNPNYNPDFANQIFAARESIRKDNDNNNNQMASSGFTQPTMPGDDTTVTPSDDAYKFNVGGTMPYTDDVLTGGKEMQVPVGKRMQLDSTGAMKTQPRSAADLLNIATQGGGFNQLEDFSNYIKRRQKFLGEEEPEYFDEDGNVIMAGLGKAKTV